MNPEAIASLATQALLQEIEVFPKPGLVSGIDNGSHSDMDAALLRRSARVLGPYFARVAEAGARDESMQALRELGRGAERGMLAATGGINTHRGAIFGLGLLCAAAGAAADSSPGTDLGDIVRERWAADIGVPPPEDDSHGARVRRRYGIGGARAQAVSGFAHVYRIGWPALREGRLLAPANENAARVQCCFALIASLHDTNLLYRGGLDGLAYAQAIAGDFVERGGVGCINCFERASSAHRQFVSVRLSPGGCADLLAMTMFVDAFQSALIGAVSTADRHMLEPVLA